MRKNQQLFEKLKPLATALRVKTIRGELAKDERDCDAFINEILILTDEIENLIAAEWE